MGLLKRDFLDIYLTTFLVIRNFGSFVESMQNFISISKMKRKIEREIFLLEVIASKLTALNFLY